MDNYTQNLIKFCKVSGVSKFKTKDIEVEFFSPIIPEIDPVQLAKALTDNMPTDEQMLFASTESIPDPTNE